MLSGSLLALPGLRHPFPPFNLSHKGSFWPCTHVELSVAISAGWENTSQLSTSPHKHRGCWGPGLSASPHSLPSSPPPQKACQRPPDTSQGLALSSPLFIEVFFFMAMLLMVHIFQSNMFRIRLHSEVMTPSCAVPVQGSLPYIWPVHIWLRLTAGQMLHPSEPESAIFSARGWSCAHKCSCTHTRVHTHTHKHHQLMLPG